MTRLHRFFEKHFGLDRREASRYELSGPVAVKLPNQESRLTGVGVELSENGALLQLESLIDQGTRVAVTLQMPPQDDVVDDTVVLDAIGEVVRVRKLMNDKYEIAMKFKGGELIERKLHGKAARAAAGL